MPFKPGQSGNPGGRPKVEAEVMQLAKDGSVKAIKKLILLIDNEDPKVAKAAADSVLDRALGKPKQGIEHSDPQGNNPFGMLMEAISSNGRPRPETGS